MFREHFIMLVYGKLLESTMCRKEEEKENHNLPAEILIPPCVFSVTARGGEDFHNAL